MRNMRLILKPMPRVHTLAITIRSPLLALKGVEVGIIRALKSWIQQGVRCGHCIILVFRSAVTAAPTIRTIMENTTAMSTKPVEMLKCVCDDVKYDKLHKIQGHIFQPMLNYLAEH